MRYSPQNIIKSIRIRWKRWRVNLSVWRLTRLVSQHARLRRRNSEDAEAVDDLRPVIIFNASARLVGLSQNAAFALLAAAGMQIEGIPVIYFGCQAGMKR